MLWRIVMFKFRFNKYIVCFILLLTMIATTQAAVTQKKCTQNLKVGLKAWQLVSYCGKPNDTTVVYKDAEKKQTYNIYQYVLNETICFYNPAQDNIVCSKANALPVKLYFHQNHLHKIDLGHDNVTDLFLKFNQKIVLGDSEEHVRALWGAPKQLTQQSLRIPVLIETWDYSDKHVTITDGVVSSINKK